MVQMPSDPTNPDALYDDVVVPASITHEQLDFFTNQTQRAVRKALRSYVRGALVGFLVLVCGIGYAIHDTGDKANKAQAAIVASGRVVATDGCNRDFRDGERFINLLARLKQSSDANFRQHRTTQAQHEIAVAFYASEFARAKDSLPDCRIAAKVVTDDPSTAARRIVKPLYPHSKG